jgi:hypothetical protein
MWNEPSGASGNYLPVCRLGRRTYASTRAARPRATAARRLRACAADTARSYVREHVEGRRRRLRASRGDASGQGQAVAHSAPVTLSARLPSGKGLLRSDQPTPRKPPADVAVRPRTRSPRNIETCPTTAGQRRRGPTPELDRRETLKPVPTTGRATGSRRPQGLCLDRSTTTKKCAHSPKSYPHPRPRRRSQTAQARGPATAPAAGSSSAATPGSTASAASSPAGRNGPTPTSPCSTSPAPSSPGAPPTGDAYRNRL